MTDPKQTPTESLLIITGTMGAGKSSVMAEASDILAQRKIAHAAIDFDALGLAHLPNEVSNDAVMYENLRSVVENYSARGVQRFLLARAIENEAQLKLCREIIPAATTTICRLTANADTLRQRVELRERGMLQRECVARIGKLNHILDQAHLEDFSISNESRPVTEVALEMLITAGWIIR